ncbi:heparinase [Massilia sp. WF1]|uniref:heparinase II/III domain-containing protein n=1 Tax=unclassified Massilia TaxID=2609279 RepID=UPI00064A5C25|nr:MULTISPECIES: heparinase II/III family protein [unclassified Massilia]ALK96307.1 heparinase [Massilia sp. WG5]KLU37706.1 heparinase [Massilia sp. WF1]
MTLHRKGILVAAAFSSLLWPLGAHADWAQSSDPLVVRANPSSGEAQLQNPPTFTWARHPGGAAHYDIEITREGGAPVTATVDRNWYLPTRSLVQGRYTWRVRPAGSNDWSTPRAFSITGKSTVFEVPDNATLRARILARARPRSLSPSFAPYAGWGAAKKKDLDPYVSRLANEVKLQIGALPDLDDQRWPLVMSRPMTAAMAAQQRDVAHRTDEASRQLEAAALLWRLKKDPVYLKEAFRRGDQLAALSASGATSYTNQDQATRQIALSLLKAVDLLAGDLDAGRKERWLNIANVRAREMFKDLSADRGRLDQNPLDSHGVTLQGYMALISTLALGELPDAQKWFDFSFRAHASTPEPWSGQEGGYANGTAYAEYTAGYMIALWDPILQATGVNLYAKPWTVGFMDFIIDFVPPGASVHAFGDGSETRPDFRVLRALANRMVSPRAAWYAGKLTANEDALSTLEGPYPMPVTGTRRKIQPANAAWFPGIGWVAMHKNIGSRGDASFYFKSSPYGSFNHSHGDQNGLLLSVGGQPLLVKAGWYDWYGSPRWTDWYHQTRSQNAITFDGGKGQLVDGYREQLLRNGRITEFAVRPAYDYAEGDATPAYGGQLTQARRQIVYLHRANAMVVHDKLSATIPHTYEFNVHAPSVMKVESPSSVKIAAGGQSVCLRDLNGNAPFAKWDGPAPKKGVTEDHGAFYLKNGGRSMAEFLVLLDVGCKRPRVSVDNAGGRRTVTVGGQTFEFD